MAYNIQEWMQGVEKDAPEVEVRSGDVITCRPEQRNIHLHCAGLGSRPCRRQGRPQFPRDMSCGSPCSQGRSSNWGSNQSSWQ